MICPKCGSYQTRCTDSRPERDMVRRRRLCQSCGLRFSSIELTIEAYNALIEKERRLRSYQTEHK